MTTLYRIYGQGRKLLYVGITDDYDRRMNSHSEKWWWCEVRRIETEDFGTRDEAAKAERVAIATEAPKYNRLGVPKDGRVEARLIPKREPVKPPPRRWITQKQAAEHLGVTSRSIRNFIARGDLAGYRLAGRRAMRVDLAEVDALLTRVPTVGFADD